MKRSFALFSLALWGLPAMLGCCVSGIIQVWPSKGALATNSRILIQFHPRDYFGPKQWAEHPAHFVLKTWNEDGPQLEIGIEVIEAFRDAAGNMQLVLQPHSALPLGDSVRLQARTSDSLFQTSEEYRRLLRLGPEQAAAEHRRRKSRFEYSLKHSRTWVVQSGADRVAPRFPQTLTAKTQGDFHSSAPGHGVNFSFPAVEDAHAQLIFEVKWKDKKAYILGQSSGKTGFYKSMCGANLPLKADQWYELEVVPVDFAGNRGRPMLWSFWTASYKLNADYGQSAAFQLRRLEKRMEEDRRIDTLQFQLTQPNLNDSLRMALEGELRMCQRMAERKKQERGRLERLQAEQVSVQELRRRKEEEVPILRWL